MADAKIVASEPLKKQTLEVDDEGIRYNESAGFGMGETSYFPFDHIDAVLRSAESVLSIQIGTTIYKLKVQKDNETHNAVIAQIVTGAQKTVRRSDSPVRHPDPEV